MDEAEGVVFEPGVAPDALGTSEARYRDALMATEAALAKARALYRVSTSQVAAESLGNSRVRGTPSGRAPAG